MRKRHGNRQERGSLMARFADPPLAPSHGATALVAAPNSASRQVAMALFCTLALGVSNLIDAAEPASARATAAQGTGMKWSEGELRKIVEADDLHIAPFREDGVTYGTPTWIWSVAVDGSLYVRAYNGQNSRWYQAAAKQKAGRIIAAGMTKEVAFELVDGADQRSHR
jgi:hypothetical protein